MNTVDPDTGYGESLRGGGAICFGSKAVKDFLEQQSFSYIMRAHEAHAEGVAVSKGARVFTVFSTSKDHNQGNHAMAGCILVDNDKLQVINRSPAYKNQYVHRRDSVSLANLPESEIQARMKLGLVTASAPVDSEESEVEEWEDFDEESSDEAYTFAEEQRRSSVDMASMTNVHDNSLTSSVAYDPNKKQRPFHSIAEGNEEDTESDADTVKDDDDMVVGT